jgi:hypothetical protein
VKYLSSPARSWIPVLLILLLFCAGFSSAQAAQIPSLCGWSLKPAQDPGSTDGFSGVTARSASDVWAVGTESVNGQLPYGVALIEHWNGTRWSVVQGANPGASDNGLFAVTSVPGSQELWAVGRQTSTPVGPPVYSTLVEQWTGTRWQAVPSPNVPGEDNELYGVVALFATNAWVVGQFFDPNTTAIPLQTLIEHWDGSTWSIVQSPNPSSKANFLSSIAASSPTDVWAVGHIVPDFGIQQSATLIEHWDGTSWNVVNSPDPGQSDNVLSGISSLSPTDAWAVGTFDSIGQSPVKALIAHWDGTSWSPVNAANPGSSLNVLNAVVALSPHLAWAVGYTQVGNFTSRTLSERWNGSRWVVVPSPNVGRSDDNLFNAVAQLPGTAHVWAVGLHFNPDNGTQGTLSAFHC